MDFWLLSALIPEWEFLLIFENVHCEALLDLAQVYWPMTPLCEYISTATVAI